jgi:hypothetical protein
LLSSSPIDSSPMRGRSIRAKSSRTRAHGAELQQVRRPALDVGADVEQHAEAIARRDGGRERRPIDAGSMPKAACAHSTVAPVWPALTRPTLPLRHRIGRDANRRARLAPQRSRGASAMPMTSGAVENADAELCRVGMPRKLGTNRSAGPRAEARDRGDARQRVRRR